MGEFQVAGLLVWISVSGKSSIYVQGPIPAQRRINEVVKGRFNAPFDLVDVSGTCCRNKLPSGSREGLNTSTEGAWP